MCIVHAIIIMGHEILFPYSFILEYDREYCVRPKRHTLNPRKILIGPPDFLY